MKHLALTLIIASMLFSCGGNTKQETEVHTTVQGAETLDQSFKDEHNARNSLDYEGTYQGVLPTASGEGMEVTLVLGDSTYTRTSIYITPGDKFVNEGAYTWNAEGTTITLQGAEPANQYFVGENVLFTLDTEGKRIESELAEHYNLTKVD